MSNYGFIYNLCFNLLLLEDICISVIQHFNSLGNLDDRTLNFPEDVIKTYRHDSNHQGVCHDRLAYMLWNIKCFRIFFSGFFPVTYLSEKDCFIICSHIMFRDNVHNFVLLLKLAFISLTN